MDAGRWCGLLAAIAAALACAAPAWAGFDEAVTDRQTVGRTAFASGGTLDQPPLTQRWSRSLGETVQYSLVAQGRVFAVVADSGKSSYTLYALDALTGATVWYRPIAATAKVTYGDGRLFVQDSSGTITAIGVSDGATAWVKTVAGSTPGTSGAVEGGVFYTMAALNSSPYGELLALDVDDGSVVWRSRAEVGAGSLALDGSNVYVNLGCTTMAFARDDGRRGWTSTDTSCSYDSRRVAANGAFVFGPVTMRDAGTGALSEQHFGTSPAVAGQVWVTMNGSVLQARDTRTGAGLWEYRAGSQLEGQPLIVNHTVYVGGQDGILRALDLHTGRQVWSDDLGAPCTYYCTSAAAPGGTNLAAGQGLLVVPRNGTLRAYDDGSALVRAGLDLRILTGPAGPTADTAADFTFAATGTGFTTRCRLDGAAWAPCSAAASFTGLRDGPHVFEVATQTPGGEPVALAARGFSVVTGRASTTITGGPPSFTNRTRFCSSYCSSYEMTGVTFKTLNTASSECRLDAADWVPCTSPYTPSTSSVLADGTHAIEVRSTNALGEVESPPARHEWVVDTVAPKVTFTQRPASPGTAMTATVAWTSEAGATFRCRIASDTSSSACTSPYTRTVTTSGSHSFEVVATDRAGNTGENGYADWAVEPDTEITEGPASSTVSQSATFRFRNPIGSTGEFWCRLDGNAWTAYCGSPRTYSNLAVGRHVFEVKARLSTYSTSPEDQTPARWEWTIAADVTPPETTISDASSPGPGAARLTFSSTEAGTFACQVDGGAWTTCSSPATFTGLSGGTHAFAVRATDGNANTDPTPATASVEVEAPPAPAPAASGGGASPPTSSGRSAEVAPSRSAGTVIPVAPALPAPVTAKQLAAALPATPSAVASALATAVAGVDARSFARDEELLVGFAPSRAGRLVVELTATVRGKRVVVARGARTFRARESGFVAVRATAAGRKLLRSSKRVKLGVVARFGAARGAAKATMARR